MDGKILIAFATVHGATQEIASCIAGVLRDCGHAVDVLPAKEVKTLDGYAAVVLGAPFYMFKMHGDAQRFLNRHHKTLEHLPFAFFGGGAFGEPKPEDAQNVQNQITKAMAKYPWLKPVDVEVVGGRFDPNHLRFPYNFIPGMKVLPYSDLRDWDAIRAWAASLPEAFAVRRAAEPGG